MKAITLKHLARKFDFDPHKLRKLLRSRFTEAPHKRWAFEEDDPMLKLIEDFLIQLNSQEKAHG